MNLQLVAPQMDLTVSYVEEREETSLVTIDGQPPVSHGVPVFQHLLARFLKSPSIDQSDAEVSAQEVPSSRLDVPTDDTAEGGPPTALPASEAPQTLLTQFASPVTLSSVSVPPPAPPSDVKPTLLPPETEWKKPLRVSARVMAPLQPLIANHSRFIAPTTEMLRAPQGQTMGEPSEVVQPLPADHRDSSPVFQFQTVGSESMSSVSPADGSGQTFQQRDLPSSQKIDVAHSAELPRVSLSPSIEQEKILTAARVLSVEEETQLSPPQRAATHQKSRWTTDHLIPPPSPPEKEGGTNVAPSFTESEHIVQRENAPPPLQHPPPVPSPARDEPVTTRVGDGEVNPEGEVEGISEPATTFTDSATPPRETLSDGDNNKVTEGVGATIVGVGKAPDGNNNNNETTEAGRANIAALQEAIPQSLKSITLRHGPENIPATAEWKEGWRLPPAVDAARMLSATSVRVPMESEAQTQDVVPLSGNVLPRTERRMTTEVEPPVVPAALGNKQRTHFATMLAPDELPAQTSITLPIHEGWTDGLQKDRQPDSVRQASSSSPRVIRVDGTLPIPTDEREDVPPMERLSSEEVESQPRPLPATFSVRSAHLPPPSANNEERVEVNRGTTNVVNEVEVVPVRSHAFTPETAAPFVPAVEQTNEQVLQTLDDVPMAMKPNSTPNEGVVEARRLSSSGVSSPTVATPGETTTAEHERMESLPRNLGSPPQPVKVEEHTPNKFEVPILGMDSHGSEVEGQGSPPASSLRFVLPSVASPARDRDRGWEPYTESEAAGIALSAGIFRDATAPVDGVASNGHESREIRQREVSALQTFTVDEAIPTVAPPVREGQEGQRTERLSVPNDSEVKVETPLGSHRPRVAPLQAQPRMSPADERAEEVVRADGGGVEREVDPAAFSDWQSVGFDVLRRSNLLTLNPQPLTLTPQPLPLNPSESALNRAVIYQIVREARVRFGRGETEMTLRLQPPHLGRLRLRLVWSGNELTAQMDAESQAVKQIIEANLPVLYQSLSEQGIRVDHVTVSVGQNFAASPFADADPFAHNARQQESMGQSVNGSMKTPQNSGVGAQDSSLTTPYPRLAEPGGVDYWA